MYYFQPPTPTTTQKKKVVHKLYFMNWLIGKDGMNSSVCLVFVFCCHHHHRMNLVMKGPNTASDCASDPVVAEIKVRLI